VATWRAAVEARVGQNPGDAGLRRAANTTLRRIARILVPLNYARGERFDHDPALKFGILPRLEAAAGLPTVPETMRRFAKVGLIREMNKVRAALRAVVAELER
jgi:hypothetical protein